MSIRIILIIAGGALATYLPRALPILLGRTRSFPPFLQRFLTFMPVSALGALIFPAVISSFPENPAAGLAGLTAAFAVAWFRGGLIFPVVASVFVSYLLLQIG